MTILKRALDYFTDRLVNGRRRPSNIDDAKGDISNRLQRYAR